MLVIKLYNTNSYKLPRQDISISIPALITVVCTSLVVGTLTCSYLYCPKG